jgi:L-fuconolactonase
VTEADWVSGRPADLVPFVAQAVDTFGPDRLMFGSDWPVCLLAASYERVIESARVALGGLGEPDLAWVFGGSAAAAYRLDDQAAPTA